jgi:hypothetical protein
MSMSVRQRTDTASAAGHDPGVPAVEEHRATVPRPDVPVGSMVNAIRETLSDGAAVLAWFVADARTRRPCAWRHVELLKAACEASLSLESELRALRLRLTWLEAESKALQAEVHGLRLQLATAAGAPPGHGPAALLAAPPSPTR